MIFIYKTKIAKVVCGLGIIGALGLASVQVDIPIPAYAETTKEDSIAKNVGKALADPVQETVESQYPYKAEGYDNLSDWLSAVKAKIQELQAKSNEARNLEYLYDEDIAALDNIEANISNTFSLVTLGEYENTINSMFDKSAARKAEAEAAEKKKALEQQQQQKQESYTAPSSSGGENINLQSAGVVHWGGYRFTWYSQRVLPGGGLNISGRHVNDAGFVCDGDGYIVAATAFGYGATGNSPWGAWKSYDTGVSGNTVDLYCDW